MSKINNSKDSSSQKNKFSHGRNFTKLFLNLDLFREEFLIRLDYEGNKKYRTVLGSIFSIVLFVLLILYTVQKV